jgi:hypothetical protein
MQVGGCAVGGAVVVGAGGNPAAWAAGEIVAFETTFQPSDLQGNSVNHGAKVRRLCIIFNLFY